MRRAQFRKTSTFFTEKTFANRLLMESRARCQRPVTDYRSRCFYSLKSSRMRLTWPRLTGISVCFLSFILSMNVDLNQGTTSLT